MEDKNFIFKELKNEKFHEIYPKDYAEMIKKKFSQNIDFWYEKIIPASKAEEFYISTGGDYSKIWDVHCECCYKAINKDTKEICYISENEFSWLCKDCYREIFMKNE